MKSKSRIMIYGLTFFTVILLTSGVYLFFNLNKINTPFEGNPPPLKIYTAGNVEAQVIGLTINETNVTMGSFNPETREKTNISYTFYTITILLKITTIHSGISSEFLKSGDEIYIDYYGWETTKPDFIKNDTIEAQMELVGTQTVQPEKWWRFRLDPVHPFEADSFSHIFIRHIGTSEIDLDNFKELINTVVCSNTRNQLFIIDNALVFWAVEGNCSDFMYQYYLYGENPQDLKCSLIDSLAGPRYQYNDENYRSLFDNIRNNLDLQDLGLGANHQVRRIF